MTGVEIVLLVLIIIGGAATLLFFLRGLFARSTQASKPYGVARQEARHEMQVNFLRGGFLLVLTLILLGIYGLTPGQGPAAAQDTVTPTAGGTAANEAPAEETLPTTEPAATRPAATRPAATQLVATQPPAIQTTEVVLTATVGPTTTAGPAATETPVAASAVVNSPNGLWLREAPGGTQELELIAHETTLALLPGRETADDLEWQQVRTPAGNEGWVAVEFLIYQN